tara:strand:+ start:1228 stop:1620 length:393 start_codon:yes stop_codon:yes gene_type:complete
MDSITTIKYTKTRLNQQDFTKKIYNIITRATTITDTYSTILRTGKYKIKETQLIKYNKRLRHIKKHIQILRGYLSLLNIPDMELLSGFIKGLNNEQQQYNNKIIPFNIYIIEISKEIDIYYNNLDKFKNL